MGSRKHRVVGKGTMKLHLISILALWSCAEWGRVDAQNRPTMPDFPDFDPRGAQHNQPRQDAIEISESEEECCPCNQREHGYGGGYGYKPHFGGGYGYKSFNSGYGHRRYGGHGYVGSHSKYGGGYGNYHSGGGYGNHGHHSPSYGGYGASYGSYHAPSYGG